MRTDSTTRRGVLAVATGAVVALAGCTGLGGRGGGSDPASDEQTTSATTTATTTGGATITATTATGEGDLDLREANVTGVELEAGGDGHRFSVTLYHDDDGEDGYANWWQVETPDGERLGRRELLHAHGTREFTRSATVSVPDGVDCVVVRGHDQTHGYGGQAMVVTVDGGATTAVRQGPEPESLSDVDCPSVSRSRS